jgi:methyl-accepting chemotaxis protein WspA
MKKLKVRQKLLLLGLLFATPFAAVVAWDLLFVKAPRDLGNVRAEIAAVSVQTRLVKLLHELQVYRDLGHAIANTNEALRADFNLQTNAVQLAVKQADDAVAPAAERVEGLGDEWRKVKSQVEDALKHPAYDKPALAYADRKKLIEESKALVIFAGDRSGLSDTLGVAYHLMAAFQYRGPDLMDALSNARAICVGLASRRNVADSENQRAEFDELERNLARVEFELTSSEGTLFTAVARVMRDRLDLKPRFDTEFQVARAAVDEAAKLVRSTLNQRRADPSVSVKDFHEKLTRATAAVLRLEDKIALTLDEVIKARIDSFYVDVGKTLAMVAVSLLVVLAIALFISNGITGPLDEVVEAADQIAEGDLTVNVSSQDRADEMGNLLRALQRMVRSLNDIVGHVQKSGLQVNTSVNQISVTGKQQQTTANEIASTATEIGATAKEISATSLELVNMMKDATAVAEDTASLATKGQEGLTRMRETMTQLTDAAGIIQSKLGVLNEKAANINQVVTAITKIADRTNLLSLNAAIEAEKAGEYGRGFSVVATEIRRLADQTAVATYDIEQMVKEMQAAVSAGTLGMNQTAEDIRSGVKEVQAVGAQLAQIIQQVQALAPRFELVNSGMQSQATGGQQISDSLSQLTKAVQQTAQSLEQSNQAIEQLKSTAYALREGVARFKLPGGR